MSRLLVPLAFAAGLIASTIATPAAAQFDTAHNNLKCYKITGGELAVNLQLDNQFGRERVLKLVPQFVCAPTQKQCCDAATGQCSSTLCSPEPSPNQPAPVDHFKCYKIKVKQCTPVAGTSDFDCSKLTGRFPPVPPAIAATLIDQFHTEDVTVGRPKMLCVPVLKIRQGTTTTTTPPPTTTTTRPCGQIAGSNPPTCGGDCPSPLACVNIAPAPNIQCMCETPCGLQGTTCTGFCPSPAQQCHPTATNPCGCCTITGASCTPGSTNECCTGPCNASGTCP